jgi:DNA-binding CsgD family transcriptional regulator
MWTKTIVEEFISEAMLTTEEEYILKARAKGMSRVEISLKMNMSISKVDKIISKIKKKYDIVSEYDPILPKRNVQFLDN